MLKNNIEIDVKVKCVEEQTTQAGLAEKGRNLSIICEQTH